MASELSYRHSATGEVLYVTIRNSSRQMWNTDTDLPAFESLTVLNWYNAAATDGNYWIALTETPASSYFYVGTWPATLTTVGWYDIDIYKRVGATPAISDTLLKSMRVWWNGTTASVEGLQDDIDAEVDIIRGQVSNIAITGSPSYSSPATYTLTAGVLTGGVLADLVAATGNYMTWTGTGLGGISLIFDFTLAGDEQATGFIFKGYINSSNDSVHVNVWDWVTGGGQWKNFYTLAGTNGSTNSVSVPELTATYTGTGVNAGKVRIQVINEAPLAALSNATLNIDQLLVGKTITNRTVGYVDGAVWVKASGTAGTTTYINGTADNPCPFADALVIAAALGLTRFRIQNGETITPIAAFNGKSIIGKNWNLALNGQSYSGTYIEGATVIGTGTGATHPTFFDCDIGAVTLGPSKFISCGLGHLSGTFTTGSAGEYDFVDCRAMATAGVAAVFNFVGTGAPTTARFSRWSGGTTITADSNVTLIMEVVSATVQTLVTGGCAARYQGTFEGINVTVAAGASVLLRGVLGPITVAGTGAGSAIVTISGVCGTVVNTATGTTLTNDATSLANINTQVDASLLDYGVATATNLATVAGYLDTEVAAILADTNELQTDWANGGRLDTILDTAASPSAGTGARTVTITVNDGSTVLEGALVRMTKANESYLQTTDVLGHVTFNVNDGSWVVAITLANYTYSGTTMVVDGNETATYSMTIIPVPTEPVATKSNVTIYCYNESTTLEAGVTIQYRQVTPASGSINSSLDGTIKTKVSDANGQVALTLWRNAGYEWRRGTGKRSPWATFIPDTATYDIDSIVGSDT
jgi:hypothetical protein